MNNRLDLLVFLAVLAGSVDSRAAVVDRVDWFDFTNDYHPGTYDVHGKLMGGTDLMYLTTHKGLLYAGNSFWNLTCAPLVHKLGNR
jgi:hypothetical protein